MSSKDFSLIFWLFPIKSINSSDAAGDEGAVFSGLVRGKSFTEEQLPLLKAENDKATVIIDGEEIDLRSSS